MRIRFLTLLVLLLVGCRSMPPPPASPPSAPVARQRQIFLVLDDAGLSMAELQRFLDVPIPMTIAVLPHLKDTARACVAMTRYPEKETILHQPMEAQNVALDTGQGAIRSTTPPEEVGRIIAWNLSSVRGAKGMNNHMGSRITEDEVLMSEVLRFCQAKRLYYLDSKTSFRSVVPAVAAHEGLRMEQRDLFLDIQHDRESIRRAWESAIRMARENGYVIAIGHVWSPETLATIRDSYKTLINQGYTFHCLSELYQ